MDATEMNSNSKLLSELKAAIGDTHVCLSGDELDRYSRCTIPWQSTCCAVVFPGSTEEVAAVLQIANRYQTPVWPASRGRNWGYGATLAIADGAIIMVLERMNRIVEVNEELAYAVIEPGVSYEQFNAHLRDHGYKLWIDCIDGTAHGSVIGNALDRGVGETPYGDHFGNLCGLEVVLPNGSIIHTGEAVAGAKTWHTHKWGLGPYVEGMFTQSNYGIVTKAGVWLMPEPEAYNSYVFEIRDEANLPKVLDAFRQLALSGVVNTKLHMINDFVSMTILTQRVDEEIPQHSAMSPDDLVRLRKKYGVSPWNCAGGIYGTRAQVRLQRRLLRRALAPYGRLLFVSNWQLPWMERLISWSWKSRILRKLTELGARTSLLVMESAPYVHKILQGIPTDYFVKHAYYRYRKPRPSGDVNPAADRCGLIWFAPILPFSNADVWPFIEASKAKFTAYGFDFYVAMLLMNPRSVICLMAIIFDRDDEKEYANSRALYEELLADAAANHYQQYRAGLQSWHELYASAPQLQEMLNTIKRSLDPSNILAPGHYGVDAEINAFSPPALKS